MKCMSKNRQVADTPYSGKKQRKHLVKKGSFFSTKMGTLNKITLPLPIACSWWRQP